MPLVDHSSASEARGARPEGEEGGKLCFFYKLYSHDAEDPHYRYCHRVSDGPATNFPKV
jgi:hypothetical protein